MPWKQILKDHGFGAVIAMILLGAILGFIPSPLTRLSAHMERDHQRDAIMLALCINSAGADRVATNRCWDALIGVGEVANAVTEANKARLRQ